MARQAYRSATPDYYAILELEEYRKSSALDQEAAKRAYRQALLKHHPDKGGPTSPNSSLNNANHVTVDEISLAYKTLSDPLLRSEYDRSQAVHDKPAGAKDRVHRTGLETVDLDTLDYDEEFQAWTRSCRCGDAAGFVVTEKELETNSDDGELTVGCKGCSLWLRVLFSVEDEG